MRNFLRSLSFVIVLVLFSFPQAMRAQVQRAEVIFDGTLRRIFVPILMYHYVSPLPPDADDVRVGLTVSPEMFRQHIAYLRAEGYQTISLNQLHQALLIGTPLPPKPIILTFDDGHIDHYTNVFPVLREAGYTATFFIITGRADTGASNYLNWSQISEMAMAGMSMEAHTKNHFDLRSRSYEFLVYEIMGSVESLEAHTGMPTRMLAYPAGRYDDTTLSVLRSTPIQRAVTTQPGAYHTTDNALEMPRLRITAEMSTAGLAHLLNSAR